MGEPFLKRVSNYLPSVICLVLANLAPLFLVIFMGWHIYDVMFLYWFENVIIGLFNVFKLAIVARTGALFLVPFFIFHYGMFCAGHLTFVVALFYPAKTDMSGLIPMDIIIPSLWGVRQVALFFVLSHGFSFFYNFIGKKEYKESNPMKQMHAPYGRIVILHITIIFGGFVMTALNLQLAGLLFLIVVKIVADMFFHVRTHGHT